MSVYSGRIDVLKASQVATEDVKAEAMLSRLCKRSCIFRSKKRTVGRIFCVVALSHTLTRQVA